MATTLLLSSRLITVLAIVNCLLVFYGALAWDPVWSAKQQAGVSHPSVFLSTSTALDNADIKPPLQAAGRYGLPFLYSAEYDTSSGQQALRSFFPLWENSEVWTYSVSITDNQEEKSNPAIQAAISKGGPTAVVTGGPKDGVAYFVSMCGLYDGSQGDFIAALDNSNPQLQVVWSSVGSFIRNASCHVVDIFDIVSKSITPMLAIVGGSQSSGNTTSSSGLSISLFDFTDNSMHPQAVIVPVGTLGSETTLQFPSVTTASDGKLLVLGGWAVRHSQPAQPSSAAFTLVLHADRMKKSFSVASYIPLPPLPAQMCGGESSHLSTATVLFGDTIYYSRVDDMSPGLVAALELVSILSWTVKSLPGGLYNRKGASFFFSVLQREGSRLGLYAVGGLPVVNATPPVVGSITAVYIESALLPSYQFDPFTRGSALVTLSVPFAGPDGVATVTVTVDFILSNAGEIGLLSLGTSSSCSELVTEPVAYRGSEQAVLSWNVTQASTGLGSNLFMCYSTGNVVWWGNGNQSTLFTAVNPLEPVVVTIPSFVIPPQGQASSGSGFLTKYWYYFALGGLGILSVAAVTVSIVAWRRRSKLFPPLLDGSPASDPFASLRISTNSHASRYVTLGPLGTLDGEDSELTSLVQRKADGEMFVMKNIPCDGDVERLLSMREFEALNVLQCHPNVVRCIDMFMSYSFSVKRFESSQKSLSAFNSQPTSRVFSVNHERKEREGDEDEASNSPASDDVNKAMRNGRFFSLVMEHHRHGNIAQFLVRIQQKGIRAKLSSPTSPKITADTLSKLKPPPENLLLCVAFQVVTLLKFMHYESEVPLSHKGLKPENILVCGDLNSQQTYFPIAVTDFGFSDLGNYAPPRTYRKRDSDIGSESGASSSRSSAVHGVNTDQMQSPKCDMWSLGCVLYSLATYKFGRSFPPLAEQLSSPLSAERTQQDIRAHLRDCGYSKEFLFLVMALLSVDEAARPSSRVAHRMFLRDTNGALGLKPNPAAAAEWKSMTAFSESSTK